MSKNTGSNKTPQGGAFGRFIRGIEVVGNKLPHPFWLFVLLALAVVVLSAFLATSGTSVTYMAASQKGGTSQGCDGSRSKTSEYEALRPFSPTIVKTYISFAPIG
jgi:aminobenzoyl-glutamate transport protein